MGSSLVDFALSYLFFFLGCGEGRGSEDHGYANLSNVNNYNMINRIYVTTLNMLNHNSQLFLIKSLRALKKETGKMCKQKKIIFFFSDLFFPDTEGAQTTNPLTIDQYANYPTFLSFLHVVNFRNFPTTNLL